jgi:sugar phosphate isomerase/epimerase
MELACDENIEAAADIIGESRRPYIYCGGGVVIGNAAKEVVALSEKIDAPVGCSMMGLSAISSDHKNALGMQGMHGTFAASRAMAEADVIIALGVRFSDRATGNKKKFASGARIIHIDIEPAELGKNIPAYLGIIADVKDAVARLLDAVKEKKNDEWRAKVVPEKLFAEVRAKYNDAGVSIHALKPSSSFSGSEKETDEQIEYWFKAAKALGADTLTMEVPNPNNFAAAEKRMKRLAAFCDKYDLNIAFHNHTQINATTYDGPLLGWSKRFFINFDIAHYVAANDDDPLEFVKKYHDRIYSIHIKDRCRKGPRRAKTVPLGEGDTPLKELFALLQKENWLYHCDIEMEHIIPVGSDAVEEVLKCRRYCRSIIAS